MIQYNPKDWFFFIFRLHKSDTLRKLAPLMLGIAVYCAIIVYLEREYFRLPENSYIKNIPMMHALLGGAISLLLVFRTNSAYDRWWEGRKQWGDLTNNSRNLALKLDALLPEADTLHRDFFRKIIPAYAFALKNHLLSSKADWELWDRHVDEHIRMKVNTEKHLPNQIADMMMHRIAVLVKEGKLSELQALSLNDELRSFTNICGACERIKNTPIPYSYSVFIKKFIFGYVMTLPFGYMFSLGYLSIPIVIFIFYVLASLEIIAEEIEDPFGGDTNDLPLEKMAMNIHHNLDSILQKKSVGKSV